MPLARLIALSLWITGVSAADSPWPQPVRRDTNSREADLVAAMIDQRMLDEAEEICLDQQQRTDPRSDESALWAIRLSLIATQRQMLDDRFDDQEIAAAQKPVDDLLGSYPDHPRVLFLNAQKLAVAREAARHAVVVASISPTRSDQIDQIFTRLARVTTNLKESAEQVDRARAALDSNANTPRQRSMSADLLRLHQELLIAVVSSALLQTELFQAGSRDYIAAANQAQQAADQALGQLPPDSPARIEIERLRVQAILRSGQYDRAASQLDQLIRMVGKPVPANIQAIKLRLDLARDRLRQAAESVASYYGSNASYAPKSLDMDLARLEFLLASQDSGVGDWIEQIERRHGVFARRRAEAISLSRLRSSDRTQMVDASIIAAQGQDWLRRGNLERAGALLSAAARAERTPDRAITRATEAAAALIAANQQNQAAKILAEVSLANPQGKNASQAPLQAAHLYAAADPVDAKAIESLLRATINGWPESSQADQARTWLIKLLKSQGRIVEAAKVATNLPPAKATQQRMELASQLWIGAVRSSDDNDVTELGREFVAAFAVLERESPVIRNAFRSTAAFVLDEELLVHAQHYETTTTSDYGDQLLRFRRSGERAQLSAPAAMLRDVTIWRLMRDGRRNPSVQSRIALTIQAWQADATPSLDQIERLIWLDQVDRAVAMSRWMSKNSTSPGKTLAVAARLLGNSNKRAAMSEAVELWDQLAAGIPKTARTWHDAKLESIKLLAALGRGGEARKRAKFVLLTNPPKEAEVRSQYETLARPSSAPK